jgi:hypothetical protein
VVTRPLGGWALRTRPERIRAVVAASLVAGATGTAALVVARPTALAVAGGLLVGVGAGLSFAPVFTGAAGLRADAPAAAIGFVNGVANFVVLVGTPLLGLAFALPGEGRAGFLVIVPLWLLALAGLPGRRALGAAPG